MRTLVVGIPLPHVTFDNYTFTSAPAFSEYDRLIVEMASVSKAVEDVVSGPAEHRDFAGHPVHNAPSTAAAFSLSDILEMRQREAEWFLGRGGILVCFAHPDVAHPGIVGVCAWRRYSWLAAPPGFRFEEHLLAGFGRPGAELTLAAEDHPFAAYISELSTRLAYQATIDDGAPNFSDYGHVLARSRGGAPVAAQLAVGGGNIILVPPVFKPESDRGAVALTLFHCLERWREKALPATHPPT